MLLLSESLGHLLFLKVLDGLLLLGVFVDSNILLLFFQSDVFLDLEKLLIGLHELFSVLGGLLLSLEVSLPLLLGLLFDLSLNELTFHNLSFPVIDEVHSELIKLRRDLLRVLKLLAVLLLKLLSKSLIILNHFLLLDLNPLLLNFLIKILSPLLVTRLLSLLCSDVAHEHL